jgi:5-methylcytosine-specific restriction endonuclease McrA
VGRLGSAAVTRLRELLAASTPYSAICAEIGCTKSTVSYYAAQMGLARSKRKHDWATARAFYEAGHSANATCREFGIYKKTWHEAVQRGDIVPRPQRAWVRTIAEVLAARSVRRTHLRNRLIREGMLAFECAFCHITDWRGQPLSLELDHINGHGQDNRLENLRLLCPNCHSQTETFSGRNAARGRFAYASVPVAVPPPPARAPHCAAEEQPAQQTSQHRASMVAL